MLSSNWLNWEINRKSRGYLSWARHTHPPSKPHTLCISFNILFGKLSSLKLQRKVFYLPKKSLTSSRNIAVVCFSRIAANNNSIATNVRLHTKAFHIALFLDISSCVLMSDQIANESQHILSCFRKCCCCTFSAETMWYDEGKHIVGRIFLLWHFCHAPCNDSVYRIKSNFLAANNSTTTVECIITAEMRFSVPYPRYICFLLMLLAIVSCIRQAKNTTTTLVSHGY